MMRTIVHAITAALQDPAAYLGDVSLERLGCFLGAYGIAQFDAGVPEAGTSDLPREFHSWIREKIDPRFEANLAWWKTIRLYSSTEVEAFATFSSLFQKYLATADRAELPKTDIANAELVRQPDIDTLLGKIRDRPAMYVGRPSVGNLWAFLKGYLLALGDLGCNLEADENRLRAFQTMVAIEYDVDVTLPWDRVLLAFHSDEREALDWLFKYYANFQRMTRREIDWIEIPMSVLELDLMKRLKAIADIKGDPDRSLPWEGIVSPSPRESDYVEVSVILAPGYSFEGGILEVFTRLAKAITSQYSWAESEWIREKRQDSDGPKGIWYADDTEFRIAVPVRFVEEVQLQVEFILRDASRILREI